MSNIDMIVDKMCQDTNIIYDDLDSESKLYIYAQAMLLDKKGIRIGLTVKPHPQKARREDK